MYFLETLRSKHYKIMFLQISSLLQWIESGTYAATCVLNNSSPSPRWAPGGAAADVDFPFFSLDCGDRGDCEDWPLGSGVVPVAPLAPCR